MDTHLKHFLALMHELQKIDSDFPLHYAICMVEISANEGLSLTELTLKTGLSLSTVSRIVGALSDSRQKGQPYNLVTVMISKQEKRRKEIFLTEKGKTLINSISSIMAA